MKTSTLIPDIAYASCELCHRRCRADRTGHSSTPSYGSCKMPAELFAARAALHFWEEPCISGVCGSGAVFFSGCSLQCIYCQNHSIALGQSGRSISIERLGEIFLELQEAGAANINLVTPTHYVPSILAALDLAKQQGLVLPIVYNTGNYDTLDTLKALEGYVDIYLPDFKYWDPAISKRYSGAADYAHHARENIQEMFRQVGHPVFFPAGQGAAGPIAGWNPPSSQPSGSESPEPLDESETCLMKRGLIVRHLLLPDCLQDAKRILRYLHETYQDDIYLSIMNQYTPFPAQLTNFPELARAVTEEEYEELINYAIDLGIERAFLQEGGTAAESFVPEFDGSGL